jgi:Flp pilus assembly protein TadG
VSDVSDERGSVTAFVVIFTVTLVFVAGLVVDGGYLLAAKREANHAAEQAARAGAQRLAVEGLRGGGDHVLNREGAVAAAQSYLGRAGYTGTARAEGDAVVVTVSVSQDMAILGVGGIGTMTVTGHARARNVRGVEQGET